MRELSGGERRYLELVIIFSLERKYIFLDEPFTGVEPLIRDLIIERIKKEAENGKAILLTDHLYRYTMNIADKAYFMHGKQCHPINGDIPSEFKKLGYLR